MEEALSEKMVWEARRVAAAFQLEEWRRSAVRRVDSETSHWEAINTHVCISWAVDNQGLCSVTIGDTDSMDEHCVAYRSYDVPPIQEWSIYPCRKYDEIFARAFYCLGGIKFEDESSQTRIPELSAHEKLELRLSLPREFWPKKWRDEDKLSQT